MFDGIHSCKKKSLWFTFAHHEKGGASRGTVTRQPAQACRFCAGSAISVGPKKKTLRSNRDFLGDLLGRSALEMTHVA